MKKLLFAIRTLLPPFAHTLHVGLLLLSLLVCASAAGQQDKQPSPIRYFNEFQGVYVGDKQPSGKTRVILHRKNKGDYPEVHLVNGKRLAVRYSPSRSGLVIGEVELQSGQPIEVYSVVLEVNVKPSDEQLLRLCRESGNKPFRLEASEIPLQPRKLIDVLSKFDALSDENRPYVAVLGYIGKRAHPDLLTAYLGGNKLAGSMLGESAQPEVARIWEKLSEADRWKLIRRPGCVGRELAVSQAVRSLDADSFYVRREAARWLGKNKASEAKSRLLEKLNTEKSPVRYEIVGALAEIGGEDVVDAMIELLAPDSWAAKGHYLPTPLDFPPYWSSDGRPTIIGALAMLKTKRSAPALLKMLQEKGNGKGYLGEFIIPVLGDLGYGEAIGELKTILAT
ncbi:MAG TPA: HEAT repeat domain-containing protein, partial [Thermoguttaceae bacterium]|nr:HEAT repeat domain-containing protein [Thermoguttaceae bacterium]